MSGHTAAMSDEKIEAIQTRWSLIRNAHLNGTPETFAEARRLLVLRYAPAIRRYLGAIVRDTDEADELAQDLMVRLMRGDFGGADPAKGRFRDFLKMAIRNLARSSHSKSARRRTVEAELDTIPADANTDQDDEWTRLWRKSVLDHVWNRLLKEEGGKPGPATHALRIRTEFPDADSTTLAEVFSQKTGTSTRPENFRQILKRARSRFAGHLIDEVKSGLDSESTEHLQDELSALGLLDLVRDALPEADEP